ncbi:transcriptional regulator [Brevibacillus porteri]|uniref:transcriptional regulator n=1 Tax=Brevibacillus porteri TaxID=2126350 RepID=UPI00370BDD4D
MFGLGKPETKVKQFLKRHGKNQQWLCAAAPINKDTATKLCKDEEYYPPPVVGKKVLKALRLLDRDVNENDFWTM